ncbi:hypothetical protein BGZ65_011951, partial [Modicella reniformis]
MALLEQLKNFIRHGKSGKDMKTRDSGASVQSSQLGQAKSKSRAGSRNPSPIRDTTSLAAENMSDATLEASAASATAASAGNYNGTNTEAASRIVAEEKQQKSKMPVYPGLERYKLIEKMG